MSREHQPTQVIFQDAEHARSWLMERLDRLAAGGDFDIPRPGALTAAFDGIDAPAALMTSYTFPLASPKPVIAAINGPCVGVGVLIAARDAWQAPRLAAAVLF